MENVDLAVIRVDETALAPQRRARPGVAVFRYNPGADQRAVVISQRLVTRTRTIPVSTQSAPGQGAWTNMLMAGLHPGNSGGGVFDPTQGCLWGIVVQEITGRTAPNGPSFDHTVFIGAADVWRFLSRFRG
jgi:S1-C subfamily serine protease